MNGWNASLERLPVQALGAPRFEAHAPFQPKLFAVYSLHVALCPMPQRLQRAP